MNMTQNSSRPFLVILLASVIAAETSIDAQNSNPSTATLTPKPKLLVIPRIVGSNIPVTLPDEESTGNEPRHDLTGEVGAKDGGPLAASVFISTAGPRTGTSVFCPSCYSDCRKSARADAQGQFKIESLSPQLIFRILAVANGYRPKFVSKVDPAKGPLKIELEPMTSADATPNRSLRGRVLDPKGRPIVGAPVEMDGIEFKDGRGSWGSLPNIDPMAVSDDKGVFVITAKDPFDTMDVTVDVRGFARKSFTKLASGGVVNELKLTEGTSLTGRVLFDGKPLGGVAVGVSGADRTIPNYVGHFEVGTGTNGVFAFVNLPPDTDYYIYGIMSTMKDYGAIPIQKFRAGKDGELTDIGDLTVGPAHRLRGRVVLSDGQPLPAKTRLYLGRSEAWDSMQLILGKDGEFETTGLPEETISLVVGVKGYHISSQIKSLDRMNFEMVGRMDRDITNLVYLLDKGPEPERDYNVSVPESELPQNRPLVGAEAGADHSREWTVSGHVFDGQTKQPLASFRATPGGKYDYARTAWDSLNAVEGTNGAFLTYVGKRVAEPLLKVEAEGYLPASVSLSPHDQANLEIALTKGAGPAGTILSPDGKPAAITTVILLCDEDQAGLDSKGELNSYRNRNLIIKTDAGGHFSFAPQLNMRAVASANAAGFALVPIETLNTNSQILLQAFGKITGVLKRGADLATNENLDLVFTDSDARGLPQINMNNYAVTDSKGRFAFEGVPAAHLEVSYRVPMNENSWQNMPLRPVNVQPGQTVDIKLEAPDRSTVAKRASFFSPNQPPPPKRIPGASIKGTILSPDGKTAADVDVAIEVEGIYLSLGKGELSGNNLRKDGVLVSSGKDGSFTLPLYEKATSVVAVNEQGFARVSLDDFKKSPQITLQKWGRIEGDLEVNHHPGTNEAVSLQPFYAPPQLHRKSGTNESLTSENNAGTLPRLNFDFHAFQVRTDDRGHFVGTFIPPGEVFICRLIPEGHGAQSNRRLGTVTMKPGETANVHFESSGRTVIGKVAFNGTNSATLSGARAWLNTIPAQFLVKLRTGTLEQRSAFIASAEFKAAQDNALYFPATLLPDGTFRVQDVTPGKYCVGVDPKWSDAAETPTNLVMFASVQEIVVPPNADNSKDVPFDTGSVKMKRFDYSAPEN